MKKAIAMFVLVSSSFAYAEPVRLKAGDKVFSQQCNGLR